jgi:hypothetical protein
MWTLPALDIVCLLVYTLRALGTTKGPNVIRHPHADASQFRNPPPAIHHENWRSISLLYLFPRITNTLLWRSFTGTFYSLLCAAHVERVESSLFSFVVEWTLDIRFCSDVFVFHHLSLADYCDDVGLSQETTIRMAIRDNRPGILGPDGCPQPARSWHNRL